MPRVLDGRLARLAQRARFDSTADLDECTTRTWNTVCAIVRDGLVQAGIDPACATALWLRAAEPPMAERDHKLDPGCLEEASAAGDGDGLAEMFAAKIGGIAGRFGDGHEPDFASASLAELLAWCASRRLLQFIGFSGKPPGPD